MNRPVPPLEYLLECSQTSLKSFLYVQLTKSANSRKDLRKLLNRWVEEQALALLSEWFLSHGAELIALAARPVESKAEEKEVTVLEATKEHARPLTYEFWRSEQRHIRRRAG